MFNVYTTKTCAYCQMVKKTFALKEQEYNEIDITDNEELREHAFSLSGMTAVPVVTKITEDGESVVCVGWNPTALMTAL